MNGLVTLEDFKKSLPPGRRKYVTQGLVDEINQLKETDSFKEAYRDNIVGFSNIIETGQFPLIKYIEAVRYVTYFLLHGTQIRAYELAFPDRYHRLVHVEGKDAKAVTAYANIYHKGKLVTQLLKQAQVPVSLMNADIFQRAVNRQAQLLNSTNEHIAQKAADSLMNHLKPPEEAEISLKIAHEETDTIADLRDTLHKLAATQHRIISGGAQTAREVAEQDIIVVEHQDDQD